MAVPVGISPTDISDLAQVTLRGIRALPNEGGSRSKYRDFQQDAQRLAKAADDLDSFAPFARSAPSTAPQLDPQCSHALEEEGRRTQKWMRKYSVLGEDQSKGWRKEIPQKLRWEFSAEAKVKERNARLNPIMHTAVLDSVL